MSFYLSRSCSPPFSMLSFSVNSISSRAARPILTAVGRAEVRWHSDSLMKDTGSSPPAPARSSTARLRQPTMAMAGAPRTWRVKGHETEGTLRHLMRWSFTIDANLVKWEEYTVYNSVQGSEVHAKNICMETMLQNFRNIREITINCSRP